MRLSGRRGRRVGPIPGLECRAERMHLNAPRWTNLITELAPNAGVGENTMNHIVRTHDGVGRAAFETFGAADAELVEDMSDHRRLVRNSGLID